MEQALMASTVTLAGTPPNPMELLTDIWCQETPYLRRRMILKIETSMER
jgi:hypothetical protein